MEDRQPTTKSILENYSGNILDIPNGIKNFLDLVTQDHKQNVCFTKMGSKAKKNQPFLKDSSNQFKNLCT